jgi:hypothetical protein
MNVSSKITVSLLLLHATLGLYAAERQWTLPQLFEAAHTNFLQMKNDPTNKRALIPLSRAFAANNCADLASSGMSQRELAQIIAALDTVHQFGKLRSEGLAFRAAMPVDVVYRYCYFPDRYDSEEEFKEIYKNKMDYTWQEAINFIFDAKNVQVSARGAVTFVNAAECAVQAARFNDACGSAQHQARYKNKYNKILLPIIGVLGVLYAIDKA